MSVLPNVTPMYLGSVQKGRVSLLKLSFSSGFASLLMRRKTADTVFVVLSFNFQVWRYSPMVATFFIYFVAKLLKNKILHQGFFDENVWYLVCTCRDPKNFQLNFI